MKRILGLILVLIPAALVAQPLRVVNVSAPKVMGQFERQSVTSRESPLSS